MTSKNTIQFRTWVAAASINAGDQDHDGKLSAGEQSAVLSKLNGEIRSAVERTFRQSTSHGKVNVQRAMGVLNRAQTNALRADRNGDGNVSLRERARLTGPVARALSGASTFETGGSPPPRTGAGPVSGPGPAGSSNLMDRVARAGIHAANAINTPGYCARGVNNALREAGLEVPRLPSAYLYGDMLARDKRFKEVHYDNVNQVPVGAIVVWDKTGADSAVGRHGHIMIAQAHGESASVVRDHRLNIGTRMRVFIPVG